MYRKSSWVIVAFTLALLVGLSLKSTAQAPPTWQYAYVVDQLDRPIQIAYALEETCRIEVVTVDAPLFNRPTEDGSSARQRAAAKAVRMLGASGWEMVGDGPSYCHSGANAIHFKRGN